MHSIPLRQVAVATSMVLISGCATAPNKPSAGLLQNNQTPVAVEPCTNDARNVGIAAGAVLGLLIGNSMGDGKSNARAMGAAMGGLLGGFIGADMDRKRCELSKVAKQYNLDMVFLPISATGQVMVAAAPQDKSVQASGQDKTFIGNTVTVRDRDGAVGHFESNSDQLTPKAREYFAAIGAQYSAKNILAAQPDPKTREELGKQLAARRIFLVGHTDDTGSSDINASLSERRAKSVASYLRQQGVAEETIYFQGAGETFPADDNRTEAGRAANRRVEIVEVADDAAFKKYLEARRPDYGFYRPAERAGLGSVNRPSASLPQQALIKPGTRPVAKPSGSQVVRAPVQDAMPVKAPIVNFGGVPYSPQEATLKVGTLAPEKAAFSFFSKAYAADAAALGDCTTDRPRAVGSVRSLRDSATFKTSEHLPQLFGKTWADNVNGNLVVINRVAVLRDGGAPANLPELKVYPQYNAAANKKPMVSEEPRVNTYLVGQGVLYRMFPRGDGGLKCVDVLFATDGATSSRGGKLVYTNGSADFVADIRPQIQ